MKVVLDSNILISDFWMASISFKMLLENSKNSKIDLHIPKVVIHETCNKFTSRIKSHSSNISKEVKAFEKLSKFNTVINVPPEFEIEIIKNYESFLENIIKDNNITIIDYPNTSHEYLAQKAMLKKKPFNENEKGYRDNLIWENVKSLVSAEDIEIPATPEVIFITQNYKDFVENHNLHKDLVEDLEGQSLNTESIEIVESLTLFKDKFLNYYYAQSESFKTKLLENDFWDFDLIPKVNDFITEEFEDSCIDDYYSFAPMANDSPTVNYVDDKVEIKEIEVKKINSSEYLVDLKVNVDIDIDYYVDKSDYWSSNENSFSVTDLDWNDHVVAVSDLVNISLEISLLINNELKIENIEIIKINDNYI